MVVQNNEILYSPAECLCLSYPAQQESLACLCWCWCQWICHCLPQLRVHALSSFFSKKINEMVLVHNEAGRGYNISGVYRPLVV